jgi:hypothetical protein
MELKRAKNGVYINDSGEVYRLLSVDREYNKKKSPKYFLQSIQSGKARYISGVFPTKQESLFSLDVKDDLGIKVFYKMIITDAGESIKIEKGKA